MIWLYFTILLPWKYYLRQRILTALSRLKFTRSSPKRCWQKSEAIERYLDGLAVAKANDFRLLQGELLARLGEVESDRSARMNYLQLSYSIP